VDVNAEMRLKNSDGQPLTVWFLSPHDAIPSDAWGYERGLILTRALTAAGCRVVFWASTFSHSTKCLRGSPWQKITTADGDEIILVPVRPYRKHTSISRLLSLFDFGFNLLRHEHQGPPPDLILTVMPTPFVDVTSVLLARKYGAKFVQDFRDLWPELFVRAFPRGSRWIVRVAIQPLKWMRKYCTKRSDALISVTNEYLSFARSITDTVEHRPHEVIYFGVDPYRPDLSSISPERVTQLSKHDNEEIWFLYGGTLGDNYDIRTVLDAFSTLIRRYPRGKFRLNVAGDGPLAGLVKQAANSFADTVRYFGPLSKNELWVLLKSSDVGLLPYAKFSTVSVPAKTFDYIAAGLGVINSLPGEVQSMIAKYDIGKFYEAGSRDSLVQALTWFVENPESMRGMKERSLAAAPEYSKTSQYAKLPMLLHRLVG
jgi:glycosyltransferase involved in cell wall biosynthesis